ncbi:MAG: hypothetical protein JWO98_2570 [Frankiales bacterium]|nr:hypothetical protein [Frankiales bacterium]
MAAEPRYKVSGPVGSWYDASVFDTRRDQDPHPPTRRIIPCADKATAQQVADELNAGIVLTS